MGKKRKVRVRKKKKVAVKKRKKIVRKKKVLRKKKKKIVRKKKIIHRKTAPVSVIAESAPYKVVFRDSKGRFVSQKTPSKAKIFIFYDKKSGKQLGRKYQFKTKLTVEDKKLAIEAVEEQISPKKIIRYAPPPRKPQKTLSALQIKEHTSSKEVYSPVFDDYLLLKRKHLRLAKSRPADYSKTEKEILKATFKKHAEQFMKKTKDSEQLYILTLITEKKNGQESGFSIPRRQIRDMDEFMEDFERLMLTFEEKNKEYFKKGAFHLFNTKVKGLIIEATY